MTVKETHCKSALARCGFPGGGLAINPYVGCSHRCVYCYARFMKRFTGHKEEWGTFIDVRTNIAEVLAKQMKSSVWKGEHIYIGTVTDPYQPLELEYGLMKKILTVLSYYDNPVSILTKSDSVLRDVDLLRKMKRVNVNITMTTLDEEWKDYIEPGSSSLTKRLFAMKILSRESISTIALVSPYWPVFTDSDALFHVFKDAGVQEVISESLNVVGGNWTGVETVLKEHYPDIAQSMRDIFFSKNSFSQFYNRARGDIERAAQKYNLPVTAYFGIGYAKKFGKQ
jgi:DNA repair photolyase